ncbi:hypothetical protein FA13DRAFT_1792055 [Coprinellus micaceus]|uniref:Uncharacterized protein n=1 Tax=Coprinellus micaceus TaxID=71717 RepID=A0A4Y7T9Y6_COPMI|nr:hypothetical protein FA13DRAFT_1792055 [Coprinellus micaceus]
MLEALTDSTSSALTFIVTQVVHPAYFPFLWAPTLHAARGVITSLLLGLPPPMAYSVQPWINYISVHLALTALFDTFPWLLVPKQIDTLLLPVDALLRATSVCGTVSLLHSPSLPPQFKAMDTPFGHALLVLSSGLWGGSVDIWGGALAALIFSASTHDSSFAFTSLAPNALPFPLNLIPPFLLQLFFAPSTQGFSPSARYYPLASSPLPPLKGKAVATIAFGIMFGVRVLYTHWLTPGPAKQVVGAKGRPGNVAKGSRLVNGSGKAK